MKETFSSVPFLGGCDKPIKKTWEKGRERSMHATNKARENQVVGRDEECFFLLLLSLVIYNLHVDQQKPPREQRRKRRSNSRI
jgi:hypothetical protein